MLPSAATSRRSMPSATSAPTRRPTSNTAEGRPRPLLPTPWPPRCAPGAPAAPAAAPAALRGWTGAGWWPPTSRRGAAYCYSADALRQPKPDPNPQFHLELVIMLRPSAPPSNHASSRSLCLPASRGRSRWRSGEGVAASRRAERSTNAMLLIWEWSCAGSRAESQRHEETS